jgi:hypothetical protein
MSLIVNTNIGTDTPVTGVTELTLDRSIPNYGSDWRVTKDEPDEVIITNMHAPVTYPEKFRTGVTEVADVYKGTGISSSLYSPTRKGNNVLVQLTEVWTVTDTVDTTYNVALPISGHVVLKIPQDPAITADLIIAFLGRLVSGLYETGSEDGTRLQALLRGALKPSDI